VKGRVLLALLLAACGSKKSSTDHKAPTAEAVAKAAKDLPDGLDLRLSDGKAGPPPYDKTKLAAAKKLSDADVQKILARAEPLKQEAGDQQDFALRPASQPPPRTGQTIKDTFPAPPSSLLPPPAHEANKELTVLRYMPEGQVPLAPELSITFSQPMVPVTSQDDAAKHVPVKLSPQPKGKWRWLGTRTLLFDPEVRFPQATTYTVTVPAGTKSELGTALAKATTFSFETPPPKIVSRFPSDHAPQHLDVPIFVTFDQKIDAKAVLDKIVVRAPAPANANVKDPWAKAGGGPTAPVAIRMLDDKEIAKHKQLAAMVEAARKDEHQGRWLAFRAVQKLPADATITVEIPAGTPSAEGPNRTKEAQTFSFQTYPPLRVDRADCGWGGECRPGMALTFVFNNPLDAEKFDEQQVKVAPAIPGMRVVQSHSHVSVMGMTKARTTYKVTVGASITDEFGQQLGKDDTRTFSVGNAHPTFYGPSGLVVLDPAAQKPTLDFFSTNYDSLKVKLYKVQPGDVAAFGRYMREQWRRDNRPTPPGTLAFDQMIKTRIAPNELVETQIDLAPALAKSGLGHAIAIVEPHPWPHPYDPPRMIAWVQSTKLAVDAHVDGEQMLAFATDLATGKPLEGVALEMRPHGITAVTDAQGLATLPLGKSERGAHYLVAKKGNDVALLSDDNGYFDDYGSWHKQPRGKSLGWFVFDDRKLYKPGEEVTLKGWLRTIDYGKWGDVGGIAGAVSTISYRVVDSTGNEIAKGSMPVSTVGGFDTKFKLPATPNLGHARVVLEAKGQLRGTYSHVFQIEEFRRPEFEVSAQASPGPFIIGGGGDVTALAKYFAGGALPGAPVNWYVTATQTSFTPPNRDDYTFGEWTPWWGYRGWYDDHGDHTRVKPQPSWNHSGTTDALGEHVLRMDFLSAKPAMPFAVTANASVTDVNRQMWNASTTLTVHPSTLYAGVKTKRPYVEKGTPFDVELIAVDIDGKAQPGAKIEVRSVRMDWEYKNGQYKTKEVDPQTCVAVAKTDAVPCQFRTGKGGSYQLTATVVDAKGRANQTRLTYWVSGGDTPPAREVAQEQVQLIPDKQEYTPGNTAELLVQAPFYPAEGVVTWRRSGIVKTERITLTGPTASLKVPIEDRMTPNLHVQVDLVGMAMRANDKGQPDPQLPKRPAYAVGTINLPIPPKQRSLQVAVTPSATKLGPGEQATLALEVKDAAGKPVVGAEAAVVVVDEAVLSLTGYQFADPIGAFYPQRGADTQSWYERAYVKLAQPDVTKLAGNMRTENSFAAAGDGAMPPPASAAPMEAAEPMADMAPAVEGKLMKRSETAAKPARFATKQSALEEARDQGVLGVMKDKDAGAEPSTPVAIRTNFNPLAAFSPSVRTDASGRAVVQVKLPDNLTRYRVVAIAIAGDKQFGKGESAVTARLPLMVRPSPPRFLNFGDVFQLPVVIQNQTDLAMTVKIAARTTNLRLTDGAGREVSVPPNDRVEVQLPAAADMAGTARLQIVGVAGAASDAANLELPVWTPATTEAFATYGVIDEGAIRQRVALPGKVWPQFGGLEVTTASTNLQALTDAMIYLVHYPFDCAEQRSSRILAVASLRDVLTAFKTKELPSTAAMETSVERDIERLSQMQNHDGGYAFWERGRPSNPYLTVYVTHALLRAKAKRFSIKDAMVQRSKSYLQHIEQHYDPFYPEDVRNSISAYALYVRKQMGDLDVAKAKALLARVGGPDKLTMEANGWLLGTLAGNAAAAAERQAILRHALNKVSETAGAANFTTSYGDGNYLILGSDRRVDAVMLEALIQEQKNSDLIPKLVTGLLAHRKRGRWLNTQENTFVLMALDLYFKTYEKVTPNFVARVWLGNDYAGDHRFRGRTTEYHQIDIAMKDVTTHDQQDLTIHKDGAGRLYYRIGMKYAPHDLKIGPADYGFAVVRRYESVDDPAHVTRDPDGTWRIKAGARVRVVLNLVNENRRYHVALVDPLPAGLEAMNPALATTGPLPLDPNQQASRGRYWWWYGPWYEHQNLRDERVEAFSSLLWEGTHKYEYIARATTPGTFIVPPPKAEEMYMPETFGRGGSDRVVIE
jgi:alpha-2-macroglobulin